MLAGAAARELKIATIAPEGSEWMTEHRAAAAQIKERTDGRVVLKFYGGGVMGNDKKVLRKIRIGQLQGGAFTASGLAEKYPDVVLYGMPFIFQSQQEVDYIREQLDAELMAGLEEAGYVSFGFAGGGFANFMSGAKVTNNAQLKGQKIWVPEGDVVAYSALEALNLSPVVLPLSDVLTGLQTGLIDVISTPPSAALLLQWYTKVKFINPTPVAYTLGLMAIDKDSFTRLSVEDQAVVREVLGRTYAKLDLINRTDNDEALTVLLSNGLQLFDVEADSLTLWRATASDTNEKIWAETSQDKGLYRRMNDLLAAYRTRQQTAVADAGS
jgi:TRAP-type C4-dicarboxylate transport system substrate-binding protein